MREDDTRKVERQRLELDFNFRGTKQSQNHLSMKEDLINIKGTMNQRYPNILQSINGCVLPPFNHGCYIYRVHEGLRKVKPEAYEPMIVSIGPYHLQNEKLQAMKEHKLWYLRSLLKRINMRVETYILKLERMEKIVRKFYDEPIHLNREKFVEMMLLDGCFIIEFFRQKTVNPKLTVRWMKDRILDDMMLLENQLPFFLLSKLYNMTKKKDDPEEPLMILIRKAFVHRIPLPCVNVEHFRPQRIKHILHLVHALCCPRPRILERNTKNKIKDFVLRPVHFLSKPLLMLVRSQINTRDGTQNQARDGTQNQVDIENQNETQNQDDIQNQMHSAVELQEAGVKFKKVGKYYDKTAILFDIKFEDGLMELPCFSVQDSTDTFLRNLIAFEQQSSRASTYKYFTDFAHFMDQLINSEKDVKLLRHKGIIVNYLGDDEEVSNLFNKLGDGMVVSTLNSYYSDVRMKVNKHCKKSSNKMRAKLMHDYFNSPWATVSTIAAAMLLLLTLLQTIASVKTL